MTAMTPCPSPTIQMLLSTPKAGPSREKVPEVVTNSIIRSARPNVFPDRLSDGYLADGMTVSAGSQPRGHAASPERDAPAGEVPTGGGRIPPSNPAPNQGAAEGRASMRTAPPDEGPADRDAIDPGGDAAPAAVPSPGMVRHR